MYLNHAQTIAGVKTFFLDPLVPAEAYHATNWDGSLEPPAKNDLRDKIEAMVMGGWSVILPRTVYAGTATHEMTGITGYRQLAFIIDNISWAASGGTVA